MKHFERTNLLVLLMIIGILALTGAFLWLRATTPSDGALVVHRPATWTSPRISVTSLAAQLDGLRQGDVVVAVAGRSMESWAQALLVPGTARPRWQVGETVIYTVERDGRQLDVPVTLSRYSFAPFLAREWGILLTILLMELIAAFVFVKRPADRAAEVLLLLATSALGGTISLLGPYVSDLVLGSPFWLYQVTILITNTLLGSALLHFALLFPQPSHLLSHRWIVPLIYGVPFALYAADLTAHWFATPSRLVWWGRWDADTDLLWPIYLVLTLAAFVRGFRTARDPVSRQQVRWVAGTFTVALVVILALGALPEAVLGYPLLAYQLQGLVGLLIPLGLAAALLRYRLFDIDSILNRTLVYGALTASVVSMYVLVIGALGALFHASGNLLIALLATSLVAMLFQPLRERLQRSVNRLMYGDRDNPYTVLARLGQRLEATPMPAAVLPTIVETVAQALKLPYAAIALTTNDQPPTTNDRQLSVVSDQSQRTADDGQRTADEACELVAAYGRPDGALLHVPLVYQHQAVGTLLLAPRTPGEAFTPADRRVLSDLARQIAIAVQAVRLTTDLQRSRERLIMAREEERRRLRRDLHDELGPTLASLVQRLDTVAALIPHEPDTAVALVRDLKAQTRTTITDIRRLVYALRPPTLDELGLVSAIREYAAQCSESGGRVDERLQVYVEAPEDLPPLPAAVEVVAYRIVREALTNVRRHAGAQRCRVRLSIADTLVLEIVDDGIGLPPDSHAGVGHSSMHERAAELGGACRIEPAVPHGTRVCVRLPIPKE